MRLAFLIVLAIYGLLTVAVWLMNVVIRLRLKTGHSMKLEKLLIINKLKPAVVKGFLATFGISIISLLTSFTQQDESTRQGLFFISALGGISCLYLAALWSFPRNGRASHILEKEQQKSAEPVPRDWPYKGASTYSKMPKEDLWKVRRVLIISGWLFISISLFLTYLLLRAMGATNNEAFVFIAVGSIIAFFTWVRKMGKDGLRKKQLEETLRKPEKQD